MRVQKTLKYKSFTLSQTVRACRVYAVHTDTVFRLTEYVTFNVNKVGLRLAAAVVEQSVVGYKLTCHMAAGCGSPIDCITPLRRIVLQ